MKKIITLLLLTIFLVSCERQQYSIASVQIQTLACECDSVKMNLLNKIAEIEHNNTLSNYIEINAHKVKNNDILNDQQISQKYTDFFPTKTVYIVYNEIETYGLQNAIYKVEKESIGFFCNLKDAELQKRMLSSDDRFSRRDTLKK